MNELLSVTEAAERIGITRSAVQQAIQSGRLPAQRIGNRFVIRLADVVAYEVARGGAGRPRPTRQSPAISEEHRAKRRKSAKKAALARVAEVSQVEE